MIGKKISRRIKKIQISPVSLDDVEISRNIVWQVTLGQNQRIMGSSVKLSNSEIVPDIIVPFILRLEMRYRCRQLPDQNQQNKKKVLRENFLRIMFRISCIPYAAGIARKINNPV